MNSLGINKTNKQTRVVVAMSGGVDSSVVAALMKEEGYDVTGITLKLYDDSKQSKEGRQCCAGQDIMDAKRVSEKLNINHEILYYQKKFKSEVKNLLSKLNYKNDTFVHRDFHVSNFMYHNKKIAVIDSQDALIGNRAYDLASLIDDVRLKTPNELKEKVFKFYVKTNQRIDLEKFKKDFEILSVLRNLKIIGIFMRLAVRDNKRKYLKLIPYAWELINHRIKEQNEFNNLMLLLKNNFPKFIR